MGSPKTNRSASRRPAPLVAGGSSRAGASAGGQSPGGDGSSPVSGGHPAGTRPHRLRDLPGLPRLLRHLPPRRGAAPRLRSGREEPAPGAPDHRYPGVDPGEDPGNLTQDEGQLLESPCSTISDCATSTPAAGAEPSIDGLGRSREQSDQPIEQRQRDHQPRGIPRPTNLTQGLTGVVCGSIGRSRRGYLGEPGGVQRIAVGLAPSGHRVLGVGGPHLATELGNRAASVGPGPRSRLPPAGPRGSRPSGPP